MPSRERILAALEGRRPDRVPVSLYEFTHLCPDHWANQEPSYAPLLELQRQEGDSFLFAWANVAHVTGDANVIAESTNAGGGAVETVRRLQTPAGELRSVVRREPHVATNWRIEPFLKDADDVRKYLSIPVEPFEVPLAGVRSAIERAGEDGVVVVGAGDPLGHVAGLFHYDGFLMVLLEHEDLILEMLRVTAERLRCGLEQLCEGVSGVAVRFWGPEYASAPLVNPKVYFPKLVVDFLAPLIERVNASGNYSIVHSHGRLDAILEPIADMRPHALEPLEVLPASTADVTMANIKRRIGERVCLMGGIQAHELENGTPDAVDRRVREIVSAGKGGGGFVLLPTSTPIDIPLPEAVLANYEAYFRAGREAGGYA